MRTLHADLTAAQESDSRTPYVRLNFRSRSRAITRTYTTTDVTNRIIFVEQSEGRWNGHIETSGSNLPISAVVRLKDQDQAINVLDFIGYRLDIGWGYNTTSGNRFSEGPPVFVIETRSFSVEGELFVEFYCMSLWDMLWLAWSKQTVTSIIDYDADVSVRHILMELLGGTSFKTLNTAGAEVKTGVVLLEDGSVFTDFTDEATNPTDGSDLGSTDDISLLPATPVVNDAFYIGHDDQFEHVSMDITTVGVGAYTGAWEIWTGAAFVALTVVDNTDSFKTGELKTISFTKPTTWVTTSVDGVGPFYYIRFRVTGIGITTQPKATKISVHHEFSVALDSAVSNQGDAFKPKYESDLNQNIVTVVQDILGPTLLVVRAEKDGFHTIHVDNTLSPIDYTYEIIAGNHVFWEGVFSQCEILPNNIVATNLAPGQPGTRFTGTTGSNPSQTAHGTFTQIVIDSGITSDAEAVVRSSHATLRLVRDTAQGKVEAPMNVGQETWDVVRVIDGRSGQTFDGRVSQVVRLFSPLDGQYVISVILGGAERVVQVPDPREALERHLFPATDPGVGPISGEDTTGEFQRVDPVVRVPDLGRGDIRGGFLERGSEGTFDIISGRFGEAERLPPSPFRFSRNFGGGSAAFFPIGPISELPWRTDLWELFTNQTGALPRRQIQPASGGYLSNTSELLIQSLFVQRIIPRRPASSGLGIRVELSGSTLDEEAFFFTTPFIAHGMTSLAPTDAGGSIGLIGSLIGGLELIGHTEATNSIHLKARITIGTTSHTDGASSAVFLEGSLKSGTTHGFLADADNLAVFRNFTTNKLYVMGSGSLIPGTGSGHDLGDGTDFWDNGYFDNLRMTTLFARSGSSISISDDLIPDTNGLLDLGQLFPGRFWANLYADVVTGAILIPKVSGASDIGNTSNLWDQIHFSGLIQGTERTDPAAPAANKGSIYFRDSGGKTQLVVRFNTGAIQVIATEP